ncbi:hypothetical protein DH2020_009269 [Rehmannia glutinosa]|uniref:UDP-glycosyltransferase n=1 Tax=Rehmannia glutinosa TaxID=99300 RepID=A0ABR0X732_REHGL
MGRPHVLAIPYPAQGHVIPLMELAQCLAKDGIKVTFVNTEFNHKRIVKALSQTGNINESIQLASIPDGLEPWEDRNDLGKLTVAMLKVMPEKLEALIEKINETESDKIVCVITDYGMGWALELANKLGIKRAAFVPTAVALLALAINAQKLVDEGIIDSDGTPLKHQMIQLSPDTPAMSTLNLVWTCMGDFTTQKVIFHSISQNITSAKLADWILCNSSYELERGALTLVPNCLPIGPLLASNRLGKSAGHFWPEDSASLAWLDQQPANSTIYVAFGSFTVFDQTQFQELALGLELTNRPFLWVVRQDMTQDNDKAYPKGFKDSVKNRGKLVGYASTEVGLELDKDESGIIRQAEIRKKVELLLTDKSYKTRALDLKLKAMSSATGGCSQKNFNNFVDWIKEN